MDLAPEQYYGTNMFIIYNILPIPVRHKYFSKYMVHPIVYLLRPHSKTSIRVKDNSYHYEKARLGYLDHEYELINIHGNMDLIDTDTCRIVRRPTWGQFWTTTFDSQYYCSSSERMYRTYISEKLKRELGVPPLFDGNMEVSEVECRKNVCSKVLRNCKCHRCHYLDDIMYPVKYLGNYPFALVDIVTDTIIENAYCQEHDIDRILMFFINDEIVPCIVAHDYPIPLANINDPRNYQRVKISF